MIYVTDNQAFTPPPGKYRAKPGRTLNFIKPQSTQRNANPEDPKDSSPKGCLWHWRIPLEEFALAPSY